MAGLDQKNVDVSAGHAERRGAMTPRELRADNRRINITMFKAFLRGDFRGGWAVLQETGDVREQVAELSEKTASATNATGRGLLWFIFPPLGMWRSMKH